MSDMNNDSEGLPCPKCAVLEYAPTPDTAYVFECGGCGWSAEIDPFTAAALVEQVDSERR